LALATATLSAVFQGSILADPRLSSLRRLAWVWSAENLLLAAAVYHRMDIYIGFNGMTRMRTIGLFGMTAVVAGFVLVLWKIAKNRGFLWLVRRQLWALAATIFLYALTPVDALVTAYNVRRIMAGDLAPSVQISVHPIGPEGSLLLAPLLECPDATIREGVRALLAERHQREREHVRRQVEAGWSAFQGAEQLVERQLELRRDVLGTYDDPVLRKAALGHFYHYAYQWY
jgi:hypothetical protein